MRTYFIKRPTWVAKILDVEFWALVIYNLEDWGVGLQIGPFRVGGGGTHWRGRSGKGS